VVLYTAGADVGTSRAALAAGAIEVLDKMAVTDSIVDDLARILLDHWAQPDATVEVRIGPIPSAVARVWVANTSSIIAAVRRQPAVLPRPIPADVLDLFDRFLATWGDLAQQSEDFYWVARANPHEVQRLVEHWALIDSMSDDDLAALGCQWAPPEGEPFFHALTAGVLEAMAAHAETQELARQLAGQWPGPPASPNGSTP
jgi:hypothetical protein